MITLISTQQGNSLNGIGNSYIIIFKNKNELN